MNNISFSPNFPEWAKPEQMDVTFVDMSDANLSYSIKVPTSIEHDFSLDWWIEVRGEKFYNTTLKPEGYKDDQSLTYNYTLVFDSERMDLKRYVWVDIDKQSGVPLIKSYANVFKLDLNEFVAKLNDNISFYGLSSRWEVRIDPSLAISTEKKLVNADNAFIWDVLQNTTEIYGEIARWFIEAEGVKLIIKIGYPAIEINHIFQYGGDTPEGDGGLVKIERTLSSEKLTTVLAGRGGERNVPERYFEPAGDNFPEDPDQNAYTASLNLHNLMPKCFRDYNRGWNSKLPKAGESEAYNQGVSDTAYRPIEWVRSEDGITTYGEIWDKLEPKEDIYATIQGIDADTARAAGVVTTATGRLDETIAIGEIGDSDPNSKDYQPTFDIYVPDIGFDLRSKDYWAKEEMTISFSSGWMSQSEDYEFKIRGSKTPEAYVFPDTSKVSPSGQRSAWRITLIKSDAELDATGLMIPNTNPAAKPAAGDYFFFTNINLPHSYVLIAEKRQEDYLRAALKEIDHEIPVYTVKPDKIFCASFSEVEKLKPGAIVRISNQHLIDGLYESVHIQSITLKYDFENKVLPDWEMVITDKLIAVLNQVQRVSADVAALSQTQITEANVVAKVAAVGDKRWLRKDGVSDVSNSPTKFAKDISSVNYSGTGFEKAGWAILPHPDKPNENLAIFDNLNVRKTFNVYEIISNQIKHMGGKMIFSATAMTVSKTEDGGSYWKLYFDTKDGQINNLWSVGDMVLCQEFDAANVEIKYYRLKITRANVADDFIHVSKGVESAPDSGDFIVQHGHVSNKERQNILVIDTIGGARFSSLQGLTDLNASGSVVAEMGWVDGSPKFFVGDKSSSYIGFDAATKLLEVVASRIVFKAPGGKNETLEDWATGVDQGIGGAASIAQESKNYIDNVLPSTLDGLQSQIDGQIESFFFSYDPTLSNAPASGWVSLADKDRHLNDTFTNNLTGASWKWVKNGSSYYWNEISDTATKEALRLAGLAKDTADGKRRVFTVTPTTPYDIGDLWAQGGSGDLMRCQTARLSGAYTASDWDKASKYTDDTTASQAINLLSDIASDNKLTPDEKQSTLKEWDVINSEKDKISDQATQYLISSTSYLTAYNNLSDYITPLLADITQTSDIVGSHFRAKFVAYYDAKQTLLNLIASKNVSTLKDKDDMAKALGYKNYADMIAKTGSGGAGTIVDGDGYIQTNLIKANALYAENIRTATSGDRVEIIGNNKRIQVFDSGNFERVNISGTDAKSWTPNTSITSNIEISDLSYNKSVDVFIIGSELVTAYNEVVLGKDSYFSCTGSDVVDIPSFRYGFEVTVDNVSVLNRLFINSGYTFYVQIYRIIDGRREFYSNIVSESYFFEQSPIYNTSAPIRNIKLPLGDYVITSQLNVYCQFEHKNIIYTSIFNHGIKASIVSKSPLKIITTIDKFSAIYANGLLSYWGSSKYFGSMQLPNEDFIRGFDGKYGFKLNSTKGFLLSGNTDASVANQKWNMPMGCVAMAGIASNNTVAWQKSAIKDDLIISTSNQPQTGVFKLDMKNIYNVGSNYFISQADYHIIVVGNEYGNAVYGAIERKNIWTRSSFQVVMIRYDGVYMNGSFVVYVVDNRNI